MGQRFNEDDFDSWKDKWDAALANGTFDKPEGPPVISKCDNQTDFFNMSHDDHDEYSDDEPLNESDIKYWTRMHKETNRYDRNVVKEEIAVDKKAFVKDMTSSANPVRASSLGNDNGVDNPKAFGTTYDVPDLQRLEDLKVKLHGLIDKLNTFDAHGQNGNKLENQIETIKKQIDEMSDGFGKSGVPSQHGD